MAVKLFNIRRIYKRLFLFAAGLLVFTYFAIFYNKLPRQARVSWSLDAARELIQNDRDLPLRINSLLVAEGAFPRCLVIAGCGDREYVFQFRVFEIEYAAKTIIVDPVHDERLHLENRFAGELYYRDAEKKMQTAMLHADKIVMTHEHYDHIGGLTESPYQQQLAEKALITAEQMHSQALGKPQFSQQLLALQPLNYQKYYHLDQGVVLIKAPAHTPGSQMIFVRLQDGSEVLFIGDTVWHSDNLVKEKSKSLLASWLGGENATQLAREIRTLIDLFHDRKIKLLIAHDKDLLQRYIDTGLIQDGLKSYRPM